MTYTLSLPWPPSVNHYYVRRAHGFSISNAGLAYRIKVAQAHKRNPPISCPVKVSAAFTQPDKRRRDLDNLGKCLLDACTKANVWSDDSQIHDLRLFWSTVGPPGVVVTIEEIASEHTPTAVVKKQRALERK